MNKTVEHLIKVYATENHTKVREELNNLSRDTLTSGFLDLLTMYMNDRNSSTLRETITVLISGFKLHEGKLGYNGYRQLAPDNLTEYCEAKPVNVRYDESKGKYNRSLSGGGNISDYTPERLEKDIKDNPTMLLGGFADGKLLYIISVPFRCLESTLKNQLEKQFPNGERKTGTYLRSANFSYINYSDCSEKKIVYLSPEVSSFRSAFNKDFYSWLTSDIKELTLFSIQ